MVRPSYWVAVAVVSATAAPAVADDNASPGRRLDRRGTSHVVVETPLEAFTANPAATVSPHIYLNRCSGGCQIKAGGINDARTNTSTIPDAGPGCPGFPTCTVAEFATFDNKTGSNGKCQGGTAAGADCTDVNSSTVCTGGGNCYSADDEWNALVQCMREVYSPYAVTVSDEKPANGVSYTMAVIAGKPGEVGQDDGVLGIAPLAPDCSPQDNVISFSFANHHGAQARVNNLCWTAAQETAHALGLDHQYQYSDGTSACNDPMTYRLDCGGQKFFRNKAASCGELEGVRPCQCGGSQNSHLKMKGVFGEGVSLIPAPTVLVTGPSPMSQVQAGQVVSVQAGSKRGVATVELWLNGYKWTAAGGAKFGSNGQPNPSDYTLRFPAGVPDSIIDIVVKVADDLGNTTASNTITVTKGAACQSADTCAAGQKCENGRCFWDPPIGALGEACEYPQYCESGMCLETSEGGLCSQDCIVGVMDACPAEFRCEAVGAGGACIPGGDDGGCCSVGSEPKNLWLQISLSALVLGFVVRRRRKR